MNKMKLSVQAILAALVMSAPLSFASPGNDGCVGNCPQGGDPVSTQETEFSAEALNDVTNTNTNEASASAGSIAGAQSNSDSVATGGNSNVLVGVGVKTGPAISGSRSSAQGGDGGNSTAYGGSGGDSSSQSKVGDTTAISGPSVSRASNGGNSTGDQSLGVNIKGDTVTYEDSASRAATVYAQVCQSGGSAQAKAGGISVVNSEPLCEHLKMAAVMREAYMFEMSHGKETCQDFMAGESIGTGDEFTDTCFNSKAQVYYEAYHESMSDAMLLIDKTEEAGLIDKFSGYMVRPMALIGALIWLL